MSSPIPSDIFQNDTKMLEEQCCEMQWKHEEEQYLLAYLEEAVEAHHIKHMAQKARKEAEIKIREEAKKRRLMEKKKKKKWIEYF